MKLGRSNQWNINHHTFYNQTCYSKEWLLSRYDQWEFRIIKSINKSVNHHTNETQTFCTPESVVANSECCEFRKIKSINHISSYLIRWELQYGMHYFLSWMWWIEVDQINQLSIIILSKLKLVVKEKEAFPTENVVR